MTLEDIKQVAVIGANPIGCQIAQLLAQIGGYPVALMDVKQESVDSGIQSIQGGIKRFFVDKGKMTQSEMDGIAKRIKGTTSMTEAVAQAELVVESIGQTLEVKREVFKQLDKVAPSHAILASNTVLVGMTAVANVTGRPDKVVGMHFFEPTLVMKLIEVVRGAVTSDETVEVTMALAKKLGKEPIICRGYGFGHLANRAYFGMLDEAVQMVWERVASPEDIDKALKMGYNLPMGPLEVSDFAGFWGILAVAEEDRVREAGPIKGHLHPLLRMMAEAGYPGGPGNKGIYDFYRDVFSK